MNILFYTIADKRSRDIESQALEFAKANHQIFLLTQTPWSELHDFFQSRGFVAEASVTPATFFPLYIFKQVSNLHKFCSRYAIDVVYSHLDPCNLISVCSEFFLQSRIIVCRHHADALEYEAGAKARWISRMIYKLARRIIVVSNNAKEYMVTVEGIRPNKIEVIPLSYDFTLYDSPGEHEVEDIRNRYPAKLLLCTIGRFTTLKRIDLAIRVVKELVDRELDVKLIVLGRGTEGARLQQLVEELELDMHVFFPGFIRNVMPYLAAADLYIHFSLTESSSTTVKEAGLMATPVIVCKGVGDFDSYIEHGKNGFLLTKEGALKETMSIVQHVYNNIPLLENMGIELKSKVLSHFDIQRVLPLYEKIHRG